MLAEEVDALDLAVDPGHIVMMEDGIPIRVEVLNAEYVLYACTFDAEALWKLIKEDETWRPLRRHHTSRVVRLPLSEHHKAAIRRASGELRVRLVGWQGQPVVSRFRTVPMSAELRDKLQAAGASSSGAPDWIDHVLAAQVLLDAGFPNDALECARRALALRLGDPHALALAYEAVLTCELERSHLAANLAYDALPRMFGKRRESGAHCGIEQNASKEALRRWDTYWVRVYENLR